MKGASNSTYGIKFVDYTFTSETVIPAGGFVYKTYPVQVVNPNALVGVKLISATGQYSLDGNVSAAVGANNYITVFSVIAKTFTTLTVRFFVLTE